MRDRLPSEERAKQETPALPVNARYRHCETCGQSFDHADVLLSAYHSVADHQPMQDSAL